MAGSSLPYRILSRMALLVFLLPAGLIAQSSELDSLEAHARALSRTDLDSSRSVADIVLNRAAALGDHRMVAWAYNWKAVCFIRNGISDSVEHYLKVCIAYCERHQAEDIRAKAELNQSINAFQQGKYEKAAETGLQALRRFEAGHDTLGVAHASYNTGLCYQRMGRIPEAQALYRRALPIYLEKGGVLDRANTYNTIGSSWNELGRKDSALYYFRQAVDEKLAVGAWAHCGSEYSNMASIHEEAGRMEEAEQYYSRSFKAYQAIGDVRGMGLVAGNLSNFNLAVQDWDSAIYYGQISINFADSTDDRFLQSIGHRRLSKAYLALGDFKKAYLHDQQHDSIKALITDAEVQKNMDELHIQYETEKRERELMKERYENQMQRNANQRKNFWLIGSGAGILALMVGILLLYRSEREKKKRLLATARADLEAERNRISMDLHDHLGAELSIITSRLDTQAFRSPDPDARDHLSQLADQAREATAQLRETIWSVRNTEVSLEQLGRKIREFAGRSLDDTGIRFSLDCQGTAELTPAQALDLFRVLQEGIHNARKYSGGDELRLEIRIEGRELDLELRDNGRGFAEDEISPGYGLANMRERVVSLGGEIHIRSDSGTRIRVRLPLKA